MKAPLFEEDCGGVRVTLYRNVESSLNREKDQGETGEKFKASSEALNEEEKLIVNIVMSDPQINQGDIVKKTGYSRSKVQRLVKKLKEKEVIYRDGSKKSGLWRITK